MQRLVEYSDYRQVIRDYYDTRKAMPAGFSWREFARMCGYQSPVYLKLVADGKTSLSQVGVERVCSALGFAAQDAEYFRLLVLFAESKVAAKKEQAWQQMRQIAKQASVKILDSDQYDYYQHWWHSVIREVAPQSPGESAAEIGKKLNPPISETKVLQSLALLESLGLLKQNADGHWEQQTPTVSTGDHIRSLAVRGMHRQMADLAVQSLDGVHPDLRDISGLTMGISQKALDRIQQELAEFRNRVLAIANEDESVEVVYRLNLQLFPLSSGLKEEDHSL